MVPCCVVAQEHSKPHLAFQRKGFDIYLCPSCGCLMADISFQHDQYEQGTYYTMIRGTQDEIEQEWGFRWRYILGQVEGRRLLDVGAGNGYFVHLATREFGLDAIGVEISNAQVEFARRLFGVELEKAMPAEQFDTVTSFNVIEHVNDPTQLLAEMRARIKPGGRLVLTTPNPGCIHRRVKGLKNWGMVDPPHHINLFTRAGLSELLGRSGFGIRRYETLSTYIRFVRRFDTSGLLLRRHLFNALRSANLGADHLFVAQRT